MGSRADDNLAEIRMVEEGYKRLKQLDGKHELLKYIQLINGGFSYVDNYWTEFFDRYSGGAERVKSIFLDAGYCLELKKIADELETKRKSKNASLTQGV